VLDRLHDIVQTEEFADRLQRALVTQLPGSAPVVPDSEVRLHACTSSFWQHAPVGAYGGVGGRQVTIAGCCCTGTLYAAGRRLLYMHDWLYLLLLHRDDICSKSVVTATCIHCAAADSSFCCVQAAAAEPEYVLVTRDDALGALSHFIAECVVRAPEAQGMTPRELQAAITVALKVCACWLGRSSMCRGFVSDAVHGP
jgi:hypothetical protein